jgi:putative endonuclease
MALLKFHTQRTDNRTLEKRREALEFGKIGEQMTAKYLTDKGYIILEHNYRRGHLEIDLIALDEDELVIVEVKSRAYDNILQPEDAVDHKKRQALIRLANEYVKTHNRKENVRFDIVTVVSKADGAEIKHLKNAYNVMSF